MDKKLENIEALVDRYIEEARNRCICLPGPASFPSLDEAIVALRLQCPLHGDVCNFEKAIVFHEGEWCGMVAPLGHPNMLGEMDNPDDFVEPIASELLAAIAQYRAGASS